MDVYTRLLLKQTLDGCAHKNTPKTCHACACGTLVFLHSGFLSSSFDRVPSWKPVTIAVVLSLLVTSTLVPEDCQQATPHLCSFFLLLSGSRLVVGPLFLRCKSSCRLRCLASMWIICNADLCGQSACCCSAVFSHLRFACVLTTL